MTTEHVSVPRELFDMAREQIERQRLAALEYGLIAVAEAHSYALHKIDAILSRATPSDDDFYCCNGVDCGCQGITKREYAEACSKKPSAPRVVTEPLSVFSSGMWTWSGTGQSFTKEEMDEAAFIAYRDHSESFATSLAAAIPPGYVLVPIEPTKAMCDAYMQTDDEADHSAGPREVVARDIYKAMLSAAPKAVERV